MKQFFTILFVLLALSIYSQSPRLEVESRRDEKNKVHFSLGNTPFVGTHTILLTFLHLENSTTPSVQYYIVKHPKSTFATIFPANPDQGISYQYQYNYIRGHVNAEHNDKIIYRLPFSGGMSRKTSPLNYIAIGKDDKEPGDFKIFYFQMEKGDTVFAARASAVTQIQNGHTPLDVEGYVSYRTQSNSILIEHKDGTLAEYSVVENNSMLVEVGDEVYPDTPLALAGSYNNIDYQVRLKILRLALTSDYAIKSTQKKFEYKYINPIFGTAEQTDTLKLGRRYTALITPEITQQEMSKKEIKKRYQSND